MRLHRRCAQGGFTLIELMLATGLLAIGIEGLLTIQTLAAKNGALAADSSMATQLTRDQIEAYRLSPRPPTAATQAALVTSYFTRWGTQAGAPDYFTTVLDVVPAMQGALDVYAATSWTPGGLGTYTKTIGLRTWVPTP
jgi:type IV pilus assembly protein PilV